MLLAQALMRPRRLPNTLGALLVRSELALGSEDVLVLRVELVAEVRTCGCGSSGSMCQTLESLVARSAGFGALLGRLETSCGRFVGRGCLVEGGVSFGAR